MITATRKYIRDHLPVEAVEIAVQTIVLDAIAGLGTAGLGPSFRRLLDSAGFLHAAASVRTHRAMLTSSSPAPASAPSKRLTTSGSSSGGGAGVRAGAAIPQATYGSGTLLDNQAILHTGGNHYVALYRLPPAAGHYDRGERAGPVTPA